MICGRLADLARDKDVVHFVCPFLSMIFFAPFCLSDYPVARALWMTVLELSLAALTLFRLRMERW